MGRPVPLENGAILNVQYWHPWFRNWTLIRDSSEISLDEVKSMLLRTYIAYILMIWPFLSWAYQKIDRQTNSEWIRD